MSHPVNDIHFEYIQETATEIANSLGLNTKDLLEELEGEVFENTEDAYNNIVELANEMEKHARLGEEAKRDAYLRGIGAR